MEESVNTHAVGAHVVEELSRLLNAVAQQVDSAVSVELEGMTVNQWHVLAALEGGAGAPMSTLAAATLLPGPSLTRLIDGMIDDNLVYRRVDDTDRRRVLVFQTRRGATLFTRIGTRLDAAESVAALLTDPDGTPARLLELIRTIRGVDSTAL